MDADKYLFREKLIILNCFIIQPRKMKISMLLKSLKKNNKCKDSRRK